MSEANKQAESSSGSSHCYTASEWSFYGNPSMETILKAVPMLQWRRCWECEYVGLYRDNMLPACKCHVCSSADTRAMPKANRILHRTEEPSAV